MVWMKILKSGTRKILTEVNSDSKIFYKLDGCYQYAMVY